MENPRLQQQELRFPKLWDWGNGNGNGSILPDLMGKSMEGTGLHWTWFPLPKVQWFYGKEWHRPRQGCNLAPGSRKIISKSSCKINSLIPTKHHHVTSRIRNLKSSSNLPFFHPYIVLQENCFRATVFNLFPDARPRARSVFRGPALRAWRRRHGRLSLQQPGEIVGSRGLGVESKCGRKSHGKTLAADPSSVFFCVFICLY